MDRRKVKRSAIISQRWKIQRVFPLLCFLLLLLFGQSAPAKSCRYRVIVRDDPSNSMSIGWDQSSGSNPVLYYGPVDHGDDFRAYPMQKKPDWVVEHMGMNNHFVRLRSLMPNTAYYFVIHDSEGVSQRYWFKTLPNNSQQPLSILSGGDSRRAEWDTSSYEPRVLSNIMVSKLRPHVVTFAGDFTNRNTSAQWRCWFDDWQYTTGPDGRMFPILPARGNHETENEDVMNLFDSPHPQIYFATALGGDLIRFYTLNTNIAILGEQTDWFKQDLEANHNQYYWEIAQYHHPIAPHQSSKTYKILQYRYWAPLFTQYHVQLAIECDSHVAKNSWPIIPSNRWYADGGFVRNDVKGTVFTGEGSWAITRMADVEYRWTRESGSFVQFKWLKVSKEQIELRTVITSNAREVVAVSDDARFVIPKDLNLWKTRFGDVYIIDRPNVPGAP
ncbi:MAG: fibronectin type III domain-containing protein [Bacteroidia bacterium]|nr:fibronectin type III domain-containing protein [Bacteroidia bacterium]